MGMHKICIYILRGNMDQLETLDLISNRDQIFELFATGYSISEIANALNINKFSIIYLAIETAAEMKISLKSELSEYLH